jgi:hypothetical protein
MASVVISSPAIDAAFLPVEPLLIVRWVLREQLGILHRRLLAIVRDDNVCRRLITPVSPNFSLFALWRWNEMPLGALWRCGPILS